MVSSSISNKNQLFVLLLIIHFFFRAKPQIKDSKSSFLYNVITEGDDKEKMEMFVNFCEDAIFEVIKF